MVTFDVARSVVLKLVSLALDEAVVAVPPSGDEAAKE